MRDDAVETWTVGDLTVSLHIDPEPDSPRNWDNLGVMVCWHERYDLGDEHQYSVPSSLEEFQKTIKADYGKCLFLPLYLIDHSGLAMRTWDYSDVDPGQWDSGLVGVIFAPFTKLRAALGTKYMDKAKRVLEGEVETYSDYLQGSVMGYVIEDEKGEHLDSCWGYYPDHKGDDKPLDRWAYLRKEATEAASVCIRERARKARELAEAVFGIA